MVRDRWLLKAGCSLTEKVFAVARTFPIIALLSTTLGLIGSRAREHERTKHR